MSASLSPIFHGGSIAPGVVVHFLYNPEGRARVTELTVNVDAVVEFLREITSTGYGNVVAIDAYTDRISGAGFTAESVDSVVRSFIAANVARNLYWAVNAPRACINKKLTKDDVVEMRFAHLDDDDPSPEALERIRSASLPPTLIIFTGGGWGVFWKLAEPIKINGNVEELEAVNRHLIKISGAGAGTHNIDRLMRLPWTVNYLNEKKRRDGRQPAATGIVEHDPSRAYTLEQLSHMTCAIPPPAVAETPPVGGISAANERGADLPDRSRDLLAKVAQDVRAGKPDHEILSTRRDHPHARDQSDPDRAVWRCIERARIDLTTNGSRARPVPGEGPVDPEEIPLGAYGDEPRVNGNARDRERPAHPTEPTRATDWLPPAVATYGASFDPSKIPLRRWLLGSRRSIGEMTVDAGPPGVNKSTLMLSDAVQIVTGRSILGDIAHETGEVLFLVGEDARRDFEVRLAGILLRYEIPAAELAGRLHAVYLAEADPTVYTLAQMVDDMAVLNTHMTAWLREYPGIVAVFVDPLAAWHRLTENSNEALQLLCTSLRAIAVQGNRHVGVDHHVTKIAMTDPEAHVGNLAAIRGAGSIGAYTRWAFSMARLNATTAATYGIPEDERKRFRRLDPLKTSYGPDDDQTRLLRVESVQIANGESVGVLVEVDMDMVRAEGEERKTAIEESNKRRLTDALARMLTESRPRSANAAALWLITHAPELVQSKKGDVLSEFTVRQRLPVMIGAGLATKNGDRHTRIVIRAAAKNGKGSEIDFEGGGAAT